MKKIKGQRKSKYENQVFGNWVCTKCLIASVQSSKNKSAGHRSYYYMFERITSDAKFFKQVRLNAAQTLKVSRGLLTVDEVADKKQAKVDKAKAAGKQVKFTERIGYFFN